LIQRCQDVQNQSNKLPMACKPNNTIWKRKESPANHDTALSIWFMLNQPVTCPAKSEIGLFDICGGFAFQQQFPFCKQFLFRWNRNEYKYLVLGSFFFFLCNLTLASLLAFLTMMKSCVCALLGVLLLSSTIDATCLFSKGNPAYGVSGTSADIMANGYVTATTPSVYKTLYSVDVTLWIDSDLASLNTNMPAIALTYFEHTNCIYAQGINKNLNYGNHNMSLTLHGNKIRYFQRTSPKVAGQVRMNRYLFGRA